MNNGWVKLHRKILDNDAIFRGGSCFPVLCLLMLLADRDGKVTTGRKQLSKLLSINENTVYKALQKLRSLGTIEIYGNNKYSTIVICNWKEYQHDGNNGLSEAVKVTTKQQQSNSSFNNGLQIENEKFEQPENLEVTTKQQQSNTITRIENKESRNTKLILIEVIEIINPREKTTPDRIRMLNARLKDYTYDEVIAAARKLSESQWHKLNGQMSVDNLLAPSKFGKWHAKNYQDEAIPQIGMTDFTKDD